MNRLVLASALLVGACGSATDDRPATLDYITQTILQPSCASAECHSAFKRQVGDQFDTPEASRQSIVANALVIYPDDTVDADAARSSYLIRTLRVGNPSILDPGGGNVRMPYDAPMAEADIRLIERWITDGALGAQCVPNDQGRGCAADTSGTSTVYRVVECDDGNVGATVETCTGSQICSFYARNGQCATL